MAGMMKLGGSQMKKTLLGSLSAIALLSGGATMAVADGHLGTLKIGALATLEGTYTQLGEDSIRGITTALTEAGNEVAGRDVEVITVSTDGSPDSALRAARKLVEQDGVDIIIGPLSGSEGIALRDYSKTQPGTTFINGSSGAMETTFVDPSDNFFRFNTDGAQWSVGLGDYVYNEKGYETVATIGEDYSFIYTQVFGFATEYCAAGGEITERFWVPLGTKDFGSIIAALPDDVDAIYLGLGGGDAVNFLNQYQQAGGDANLIGGSIMVDGTVLNSEGSAKAALTGVPSSGMMADTSDDPRWTDFVDLYQTTFDEADRFPAPTLFSLAYYNSTSAMLQCMEAVGGDLSDGQAGFRDCLSNLTLEAPNGNITLDENRQAIGSNFVVEVREQDDGSLATEVVSVIENVNQTLGIDPAAFAAIGLPGRDTPACQSSY